MPFQYTGRRVKNNDSQAIPRYIVAVNCESDKRNGEAIGETVRHGFGAGSAIFTRIANRGPVGTSFKRITNGQDFWNLLASVAAPRRTVWVVGHCILGQLKQLGLQAEMEECRFVLDRPRSKRNKKDSDDIESSSGGIRVITAPPTIIGLRCVANGGRVIIVDTLNWVKLTVDQMAELCGVDLMRSEIFPGVPPSLDGLSLRKCLTVMRFFLGLIGYVKENNMGMFRYTATGQAYSCYRHRGMTNAILIHDNAEVKLLERRGYFGARTQVFRRGRISENVWQYDVNSLFPYCMMQHHFPNKLVEYEMRTNYGPLPNIGDYSNALAEVAIHTELYDYPLRIEKHAAYPSGTFYSVLCGPELQLAEKRGDISAIRSWARYDRCDLFSLWVRDMYKLRRTYADNGDKVQETLTKTLMNCLYGKFGQMSPEWKPAPDDLSADPWTTWPGDHPETGETTQFRAFGWDIEYQDGKKEIDSSFVAISAFITSYARVYMNGIREICGLKNVYYQGCDSVIVNEKGHENLNSYGLVHPSEMGKLKLIYQSNCGEIHGQHDYRLGDKTVIAGRAGKITEMGCNRIMQHRFSGTADLFKAVDRNVILEKIQTWERSQSYSKDGSDQPSWVKPLDISG